MADFFYVEIVPKPIDILRNSDSLQYYYINEMNISDILWGIEGGFIISTQNNNARIVWKSDETIKSISVSGRYKNGASFFKTLELK